MSQSEFDTPPMPTCPNCGAPISATGAYCPNCGYGRPAVKRSNPWLKLLLVFVFSALILPIGAMGACFLAFSQGDAGFMALGIGGLGLALVIFVLMIRAVKSV